VEELKNMCNILIEKPKGKRHLEVIGVDRRIIIKFTLK
jgi:hypothetical protein